MSKYSLKDYIDLQHTIKLLRRKNKLSQRRLGNKLQVSAKTISAYETGRVIPPIEMFFKLLDACGYTLEIKEDIYKTPKKLTLPASSSR